jgi:hypothetical protein
VLNVQSTAACSTYIYIYAGAEQKKATKSRRKWRRRGDTSVLDG